MKVAYSYKTDHKSLENSAALADKTTKNGKIFILAEGSTNDVRGQFAAKLTVHSILEFVDKKIFSNVYLGLNEAIQYANSQVYRKVIQDENLRGVHVSVAILLVKDEGVFSASLGSTFGYVKSDNKLVRLHKDSGNVQVQGYKDQSNVVPVAKALGNLPLVSPFISNAPYLAKPGDVFVLATSSLVKSIGETQLNNKVFYTDIDVNAIEIVESSKKNGGEGSYTVQLITVIEGAVGVSTIASTNISSQSKQQPTKHQEKLEKKTKTPVNMNFFGKKAELKVALLVVGVLIFLFAMLRSPKDDSNMKFDEKDTSAMVNDTTNQYQDLDDIMEYEAPVEEDEEEEEDEENNDSTTVEIPEELRETPAVADGDEGGVEQKVESEVEQETKAKEPKPKTSKSSVYVVKSGDNLGRISEKFHVKMEVIKKANNLSGDGLRVGQELIIP